MLLTVLSLMGVHPDRLEIISLRHNLSLTLSQGLVKLS